MAKLRSVRPRLREVKGRLWVQPVTEAERTAERLRQNPWRALYNCPEWKAVPDGLRWRVLLRDHFTCQMCGLVEADTSRLVGDHKTPHRGDLSLFFDERNVWCLCSECHNRVKQAEERGGHKG